jgi:hypothetical protein
MLARAPTFAAFCLSVVYAAPVMQNRRWDLAPRTPAFHLPAIGINVILSCGPGARTWAPAASRS